MRSSAMRQPLTDPALRAEQSAVKGCSGSSRHPRSAQRFALHTRFFRTIRAQQLMTRQPKPTRNPCVIFSHPQPWSRQCVIFSHPWMS